MKFDLFPNEYKESVNRDTISNLDKLSHKNQESIRNLEISIEEATKGGPKSVWGGFLLGCICGLIIGLIASIIVYFSVSIRVHNHYWEKFAFFFPIIPGGIIGGICAAKVEAKQTQKRYRLLQVKREFENKNNEARGNAERKIEDYECQFEQAAIAEAAKYVNSNLVAEVKSWMTQYFANGIANVKRESYTETVVVPFSFRVFPDRITCGNKTFDFNSKRCENLSNRVEQAALARVIASALQLQISMLYPCDPSGTENTIGIQYSYSNDSADVTMKYSAANGYFEPKRSWTL